MANVFFDKKFFSVLLAIALPYTLFCVKPAFAADRYSEDLQRLINNGGGKLIMSNKTLSSKEGTQQPQSKNNIDKKTAQTHTFGEQLSVADNPVDNTIKEQAKCCEYEVDVYLSAKGGYLPDRNSQTDFIGYGELGSAIQSKISDNLEVKLSGNVSYINELGSQDFSRAELDYDENFLRYNSDNFAATIGAQKVIWGRVDDIKPTDQLGAQDLRTFVMNDYEDRRLATPSLRFEYSSDDVKLDTLFVTNLRERLPDNKSVWSFIDREQGRILGLETAPGLSPIIQNLTVDDDVDGIGGGGVRLSKSGQKLDYALTAQRVRRSIPFYAVNPEITDDIRDGVPIPIAFASATGETLSVEHPWGWVLGSDISVPFDSSVFRAEGAWITDSPLHSTSLETQKSDLLHIVAGIEFYPGDQDIMVIVQASALAYLGADNVMERPETYSINGTIQNEFSQGRWIADLDYSIGLNQYDIYINPKVTFKGFDDNDLFIEGHFFDGNGSTIGNFFHRNSSILVGFNRKLY